jgi:hypothetical protein
MYPRPGKGVQRHVSCRYVYYLVILACRIDVVMPSTPTLDGYWAVPIQAIQLDWPRSSSNGATAGRSSIPAGACSSSVACVGLLDSGTSLIYGSIEQVKGLVCGCWLMRNGGTYGDVDLVPQCM